MISQELFHFLRTNSGGRNKWMAFKTNVSKTYDMIECDFTRPVMQNMGYSETWAEWIMRCLTSLNYHILLNGQAKGTIVPKNRLCQGDILSPLIFILCTKMLVSLLNYGEDQGQIIGMCVSRASPLVSHIFFSDDNF